MLRVAYIEGQMPARPKRISPQKAYREQMLAELSVIYANDRIAARRKYAAQHEELAALELKLNSI